MNLELVSKVLEEKGLSSSPTVLVSIEKACARINETSIAEWEHTTTYNATFRNAIVEIYKKSPKTN